MIIAYIDVITVLRQSLSGFLL